MFVTIKELGLSWSQWASLRRLPTIERICGFCGNKVGLHEGYEHGQNSTLKKVYIYICPVCGNPLLFINGEQFPSGRVGRVVNHLPKEIDRIYEEINSSYQFGNYTAVFLLARKLIMHIAVTKAGAKEGQSFVKYIDTLEKANILPANL